MTRINFPFRQRSEHDAVGRGSEDGTAVVDLGRERGPAHQDQDRQRLRDRCQESGAGRTCQKNTRY
jgi:hypothetical protein